MRNSLSVYVTSSWIAAANGIWSDTCVCCVRVLYIKNANLKEVFWNIVFKY